MLHQHLNSQELVPPHIQQMSLSSTLTDAVFFGDETATFRMGAKYPCYVPGPCVFTATNGLRIPVELTDVPSSPTCIGDLTESEIRRNGYPLSDAPREGELDRARAEIAENMKRWYPHERHCGFDTRIYVIRFNPPAQSAALADSRKALSARLNRYFDITEMRISFVPNQGSAPDPDLLLVEFECNSASAPLRGVVLRELNKLIGAEDGYKDILGDSARVTTLHGPDGWSFARGKSHGNFIIVCDPEYLAQRLAGGLPRREPKTEQ